MIDLAERWEKLIRLFSEDKKENLAFCLQEQYEFNKKYGQAKNFQKYSIPLVMRLFNTSQVMINNTCQDGENPQSLVFNIKHMYEQHVGRGVTNLDSECEYLSIFSEVLSDEIDKKIDCKFVFKGFECKEDGTFIMHFNKG